MRGRNKSATVSARLLPETKTKLEKSGYNPREAIEWFVHTYYVANPKKKMKIKKDLLEIKLKSLKEEECQIQVEISAIERELDSIERELDSLVREDLSDVEEIKIIDEEIEEDDYPIEVIEALELIQNAFDSKRDFMVSSNTDISEAIDSFMVLHGDVVQGAFKRTNLKWKEFREIVLAEIR